MLILYSWQLSHARKSVQRTNNGGINAKLLLALWIELGELGAILASACCPWDSRFLFTTCRLRCHVSYYPRIPPPHVTPAFTFMRVLSCVLAVPVPTHPAWFAFRFLRFRFLRTFRFCCVFTPLPRTTAVCYACLLLILAQTTTACTPPAACAPFCHFATACIRMPACPAGRDNAPLPTFLRYCLPRFVLHTAGL